MINSHFDIRDSCTDLSRFLHENLSDLVGPSMVAVIIEPSVLTVFERLDVSMISVSDLTSVFSFMSTVLDLVGPSISTVFDLAGSSTSVIVCDNLMSVVHFVSGFSPSTIRLEFVY